MVTIFPQAASSTLEFRGEYQLFSSHDKAVNLINQFGQLVSFHPSLQYLSPFGIAFRPADFEYVRSTCLQAEKFSVDSLNSLLMERCRIIPSNRGIVLKVRPTSCGFKDASIFSNVGVEVNGFGCSNEYMLNQLLPPIDSIAEYLKTPTLITARQVVQHIGLGQGLTPSFDDVLVGLLATLFCQDRCKDYLDPLTKALAETDLSAQTTTVSKSFIIHAMHGEFSYPLLKLISSFKYDSKTVEQAIKQFIQHGHTSGRDTLLGIAIAFQYID
ncbi:DUF2877 domain-containing protein [Vibrio sp.]|uniref:DUF2877 domain-containing protein n=1 Tax=Vibrio sp. TaxID=678 RepID=UPI003D0E9E9C